MISLPGIANVAANNFAPSDSPSTNSTKSPASLSNVGTRVYPHCFDVDTNTSRPFLIVLWSSGLILRYSGLMARSQSLINSGWFAITLSNDLSSNLRTFSEFILSNSGFAKLADHHSGNKSREVLMLGGDCECCGQQGV